MPASADVGTNIKNLKAVNKSRKRSKKQILAIALAESRKKKGEG